MTGLSSAAADDALDAIASGYTFMQMHTGDPGSAGTANVATENTRVAITYAAASSNNLTNSASVDFPSVAATETWTHFTVWSLVSSGVFGYSGTVSNGAVVIGADVSFAIGDVDVSFTLAA